MSERRESLRLFANSAPTTPSKRGAENEDNTQESVILDGKRSRRSTLGTGKSILKSPGGNKSPSRAALLDADAALNSTDGPSSAKKEKGVTFDGPKSAERKAAADRKSKNFRKSLGRRVSFAQTAHIRLFEKDDDWIKSPDNRTQEVGDFNFAGPSSGFQIPDLSSVRRTSDAFDLRLSFPGAANADTSISSDTTQRSFEIALKGGSPEPLRAEHLASDEAAGRHVLDLSFSTIAPGSAINSSIPPSPAGPAAESPRRSPRRLSAVSAASRRRSLTSQHDDGEDLTNNSMMSASEFGENLSEMSMELVECDGGIESMRRFSSASLPSIKETGGVLDTLETEDQDQDIEADQSFQKDDTIDSAAMDETIPIGGISVIIEEESSFQRPRAYEPEVSDPQEAVEEDNTSQSFAPRPSMGMDDLPMDVTRCIGGIMPSGAGSDLGDEEVEEPTSPKARMSLGSRFADENQVDDLEVDDNLNNVVSYGGPLDDMTETTEQLQRAIMDATAPIYTVHLGEGSPQEDGAGSAPTSQEEEVSKPSHASLAPSRKSPRRSVAPAEVSPLRRRATVTAALQTNNTFSPLRTSFTAPGSPLGSNRRRSVARFSLGSPSDFDTALEGQPLAMREENSYPGGSLESSVPVDIMNEEFDAGDDSFISAEDSQPKGPITLERFLSTTGFDFKLEDDIEVRRNTNAFLTIQESEPGIDVYVKTNSLDMPELEMMEFGCKELSQYITNAKTLIQKSDTVASEDNPLLFLEFQEADEVERETILRDLRATHAHSKLVAREGWYTWKEKLVDGWAASLVDTRNQFEKDAKFIDQFLEQLEVFVPEAKLHLEKLRQNLQERNKSKTAYDAEMSQKLASLNADVVSKRIELAAMPGELMALKEQFALLEVKNDTMVREKRTLAQDIESATKTRDGLKLLSKQQVKEWSDSLNLFSAIHSWKPSGHKALSFFYDSIVVASFTEVDGVLSGDISLRFDESRPRLGRKTPCFADRGRRADMKQVHEFFLDNVRKIAMTCDVVQLPVTLDRIAQLWDRLKTWERSLEQTRLRSPVRLTFDKVASVLQVLVSAKGNPSTSMVRCSEDGSLSISSSN